MSQRRDTQPNAIIEQIRRLRKRDERLRTGTFYAEGNRIVEQAVKAGAEIDCCILAPAIVSSERVWNTVTELRANQVPIVELDVDRFNRLCFKNNPSGIAVVARSTIQPLSDGLVTNKLGWVALDAIGNPGNLGAILRSCDAVGCSGVLLLGNGTDPYHPDAIQASMGAIFALQLVETTFAQLLQWKRRHGYPMVGTSATAATTYRQVAYQTPLILLMGSERLGLSADKLAICDIVTSIPIIGTSDSLNLAVATSVILYEVFHQQHQLI